MKISSATAWLGIAHGCVWKWPSHHGDDVDFLHHHGDGDLIHVHVASQKTTSRPYPPPSKTTTTTQKQTKSTSTAKQKTTRPKTTPKTTRKMTTTTTAAPATCEFYTSQSDSFTTPSPWTKPWSMPNKNRLPFNFNMYNNDFNYDENFDYENSSTESNDDWPPRRGGRKRRRIDPGKLGGGFGLPQIMGSGGNPFADTGLSDRRPDIPKPDISYISLNAENYTKVDYCDEVFTCPKGKLAYFKVQFFDTEGPSIEEQPYENPGYEAFQNCLDASTLTIQAINPLSSFEQFVYCGQYPENEWVTSTGNDASELIFSYNKEPTEGPNNRKGFFIWLKCDDPPPITFPITTTTYKSMSSEGTTPGTSLGTTPGSTPGTKPGSTVDTTPGTSLGTTLGTTPGTAPGSTISMSSLETTVPQSNRLEAKGFIATTIDYTDDLADPSSQAFKTNSANIASELEQVFESTDDVAKATITVTGFRTADKRKRRSIFGGTVLVDFVAVIELKTEIFAFNPIEKIFEKVAEIKTTFSFIKAGALAALNKTVSISFAPKTDPVSWSTTTNTDTSSVATSSDFSSGGTDATSVATSSDFSSGGTDATSGSTAGSAMTSGATDATSVATSGSTTGSAATDATSVATSGSTVGSATTSGATDVTSVATSGSTAGSTATSGATDATSVATSGSTAGSAMTSGGTGGTSTVTSGGTGSATTSGGTGGTSTVTSGGTGGTSATSMTSVGSTTTN